MTVREVLDRTDLASVLTELSGEPVHAGRLPRWRCCTSDHPDTHPSVTMHRARDGIERWKCWSGGHGGTAIDAVMMARGVSAGEAIRTLEERAGVTPAVAPGAATTSRRPPVGLSTAARAHATECAQRLWMPEGRGALEWLHDRGLPDDVLRANLVGYDPGPQAVPRPAGMPRYRGVVYPSFNFAGDMIYAQTRTLDPGAPCKFLNPAAAHGTLPAVSYPRGAHTTTGPMLVTEGVPDGLVAIVAGYRVAALISASVATPAVAAQLALRAGEQGVILALDNDQAGRNAQRLLHHHLDGHTPVRVLRLPDGADLTDTYRRTQCTNTPSNSATPSIN